MASYNFDPKKKEEVKAPVEDKVEEAKQPKKKHFHAYGGVMYSARYGNPLASIIVGSIFVVASIAMTFVFALVINNTSGRIECPATISRIDRAYHSYSEIYYTVWVTYTVEDENYEVELGAYESGMHVNQEITIWYLETNPSNIRYISTGMKVWPYVICGLCFAAGAASVTIPVVKLVKTKKQPAI